MSDWKGRSRGSSLGYRFFIWTIKSFGLRANYRLIKIVSFYYYLLAREPKRSLKAFYSAAPSLQGKRIKPIIRKNFYYMGVTLVDRIAHLMGNADRLTFTNEGEHHLQHFASNKDPLILISAHLGNWEIAGNLLRDFDKQMNVVMFDGESEGLKLLLKNKVGTVNFKIIPIKGDFSHVFMINAAVKKGETVCIHADRFLPGAKTIEVEIFNNRVELPYGPFQIAAKLKAHYCFVFSVKNSVYNYHFSSTVPKLNSSAQQIAEEFADLLEIKIQEYPEQWYNYHKFFKDNASNKG